jgi:hypothetical protein
LQTGCHPKEIIAELSEDLLAHYAGKPLISQYDVYQHLMDYWAETMQDDCYLIADEGWKAKTYRIIEKDKKERRKTRAGLAISCRSLSSLPASFPESWKLSISSLLSWKVSPPA